MFDSLIKTDLELLFLFRNYYPLKSETTLVEKHVFLQVKLLGSARDFTVHLKGDDAGLVDGSACNHDGAWARSAVSLLPSCIRDACDGQHC